VGPLDPHSGTSCLYQGHIYVEQIIGAYIYIYIGRLW
jgi:hypothetical protein